MYSSYLLDQVLDFYRSYMVENLPFSALEIRFASWAVTMTKFSLKSVAEK